jgi:hypothetical protein
MQQVDHGGRINYYRSEHNKAGPRQTKLVEENSFLRKAQRHSNG